MRAIRKLQILGAGCPKCKKMMEVAEEAAKSLGIEYEVEKITNIRDIMSFRVLVTPALAVDGVVKVAGKVPSVDEVKDMLS